MTRAELYKAFQQATGLTGAEAAEFAERLYDIMAAELLGGGEVPLPRIGKLFIKNKAARKGRNPRTGEAIDIPARKALMVKAGKDFAEALN